MTDESSIREFQRTWFRATMDGDVATIDALMTEDIVFMTIGRPPFGRKQFIDTFNAMKDQVVMICDGEYEEIIVARDIAYTRARLDIRVTARSGGATKQLSGHTMSVLRRTTEGKWQLCRDANLLAISSAG